MTRIRVQKMCKSGWKKEARTNYTCPDDTVMIGREHKGDENGKTRYTYGLLRLNNTICTISRGKRSSRKKESDSHYICPKNTVMIGREHKGDENGKTRYIHSFITLNNVKCTISKGKWSRWIEKESDSRYTCPYNTVMIGREHEDDENGRTRYKYAKVLC